MGTASLVLVKSGRRFSKNAVIASLASAECRRGRNSSISASTACSICSRNGCFNSLLHARIAPAGFAAVDPLVFTLLAYGEDASLGVVGLLESLGLDGAVDAGELAGRSLLDNRTARVAGDGICRDSV